MGFSHCICALILKQVKWCNNIIPKGWTGVYNFHTLYKLTNQLTDQRDRQKDKASRNPNKAGYTATPVACGWSGVVIDFTRSFGQEQ